MSAPCFSSFDPNAVKFLGDLKANNSREWFNDHKKDYEQWLKKPAAEFCAALCGELEALCATPISSKVFRIHRDVRFAKDKTPYNAHLHISFFPESESGNPPAWFFGLEHDKLVLGGGLFAFDKEQLGHYREKVAYDGEGLQQLLTSLEKKGFTQQEPELKRIPSGYDKEHPRGELLRRKGVTTWYSFDNTDVATANDAVERCMEKFTELQPLITWLATRV